MFLSIFSNRKAAFSPGFSLLVSPSFLRQNSPSAKRAIFNSVMLTRNFPVVFPAPQTFRKKRLAQKNFNRGSFGSVCLQAFSAQFLSEVVHNMPFLQI